jgi:hypothetical protein
VDPPRIVPSDDVLGEAIMDGKFRSASPYEALVEGLLDPRWKIEVEADAIVAD